MFRKASKDRRNTKDIDSENIHKSIRKFTLDSDEDMLPPPPNPSGGKQDESAKASRSSTRLGSIRKGFGSFSSQRFFKSRKNLGKKTASSQQSSSIRGSKTYSNIDIDIDDITVIPTGEENELPVLGFDSFPTADGEEAEFQREAFLGCLDKGKSDLVDALKRLKNIKFNEKEAETNLDRDYDGESVGNERQA